MKLQQAQAQLAFTRDADSRESLQREIDRLKSSIRETEEKNAAEEQKAAIKAELEKLKQSASAMISQAQNAVSPQDINPYITQFAPNLSVNASGLSVAQAQQMIQRALQQLLYGM